MPLPVEAAPAEADEPTGPISRPETAGTAAVGSPAVGSPPTHRRRRSGRVRAAVAAAAIVGLGALAVAALDDRDPVAPAGGARAGESPSPTDTTSPSPPAESPSPSPAGVGSVEESFAGLLGAINGAFSSGQIADGDTAEKLGELAFKIAERYQEGKLEDVGKEASKLSEELGKLVEEGRVSFAAAEEIRAALDGFVSAISSEAPSSSFDGGDEDDEDEDEDDD
jgi:hypothetical protein